MFNTRFISSNLQTTISNNTTLYTKAVEMVEYNNSYQSEQTSCNRLDHSQNAVQLRPPPSTTGFASCSFTRVHLLNQRDGA